MCIRDRLNAVLRSSGHPQKAMYATIATVVINTILDPVFIYGFGWGIRGAAVALSLIHIFSKDGYSDLCDKKIFWRLLDWRGDKYIEGYRPLSSSSPDLLMAVSYTHLKGVIEIIF